LARHGLVICAGLYSSGSTWVFNTAAELEQLDAPERNIAALYADELSETLEQETAQADAIIIKTHIPDAAIRVVAARTGAPVILSVRDPRDGIVSQMQRFSYNFDDAAAMVARNCTALMRLVAHCRPLVLRYEEGFTSGPRGIASIAAHLGITASGEQIEWLSAKLSPESVTGFISELTSGGYFDDRPFRLQWHRETLWHPNHVGDGRIGKYASVLTEEQIAAVSRTTSEFCTCFGYG
jgi:hypothetical protein